MMRFLSTFLRGLRALSYRTKLVILTFCFLICLLLFTASSVYTLDASIFAIPVALASWMFRRRETSICVGIVIFTVAIFNLLYTRSYIWPRNLVAAFIIGSLIFIFVALFVSYLRTMLDVTEKARSLAQEAQAQIAEAHKQQQQLNHAKDQLLLNVSHEMRTPLTEIHGYLDLLHNYDGQLDTQKRGAFLINAMSGCEELEILVNNVLDAMYAGNITPRLDKIAVAQLVQEVVQQFDPRKTQAFTLHIDIPEHLHARADLQYVRRVLRNLLSNAFKYAPLNTPITLSADLHLAENGGTYVCISVQDAGPGIPPQEKSQLFEKFVRLERDLYSKTRGTGLGLYISRQLVEGMGGTIWVESSGVDGEGSTFNFTLPYVPSKPKAVLDGNTVPQPISIPFIAQPDNVHGLLHRFTTRNEAHEVGTDYAI